MSGFAVCPRCHALLEGDGGAEGGLNCDRCGGSFLVPQVKPEFPPEDAGLVDPDAPNCPACLVPMRSQNDAALNEKPGGVFACPGCGGNWTDGDPQASQPEALVEEVAGPEDEGMVSAATKKLLYGLSLPERVVRSAIGMTAGTVKEVAEFVVPQAFQDSTSYEIAVKNSLAFLTETVGGVAGEKQADSLDEAGEHIARKAVGNFLDLAGLATLHVSPMWALAVVSDVCYGTKTYIKEVAGELQQQGVIDETSTIHNVDDLLDALQQSAGRSAGTLDRPPLSVAELRQTVQQARDDLSRADVRKLVPQAELRNYWREMEQAARQEGVSLLDVSAAVTMNTLSRVQTVSHGALTGVRVAGGLFNRNVFGHYRDSLNRVREQGLYTAILDSYRPYVAAVWNNFSGRKKSWTESLLDPENVTAGVRRIFDVLEGRSGEKGGE